MDFGYDLILGSLEGDQRDGREVGGDRGGSVGGGFSGEVGDLAGRGEEVAAGGGVHRMWRF